MEGFKGPICSRAQAIENTDAHRRHFAVEALRLTQLPAKVHTTKDAVRMEFDLAVQYGMQFAFAMNLLISERAIPNLVCCCPNMTR